MFISRIFAKRSSSTIGRYLNLKNNNNVKNIPCNKFKSIIFPNHNINNISRNIFKRHISNEVLSRIERSKVSLTSSMETLERGMDEDGSPLTSDDYGEHSKNISDLKPLVDAYTEYVKYNDEIEDVNELIEESVDDHEFRSLAIEDKQKLLRKIEEAEQLMMELLQAKDSEDNKNVVLEVRAGAGGTEAALFAKELFEMYEKYSINKGWNFKILSRQRTVEGTDDGNGYSNAAAQIIGEGAYGRLKFESGVHRVQRVPTTEKQGRIQTSTAAILILPEAKEADVDVKKDDLRIETMRGSGAGGQHRNTTDSAVRITHAPTGIVVYCADERSQHKNKAKALSVLYARIYDMEKTRLDAERQDLKQSTVHTLDRSARIRTYNFQQSRVTDHRIGYTLNGGLNKFLTGDVNVIDELVDELVIDAQAKLLESECQHVWEHDLGGKK